MKYRDLRDILNLMPNERLDDDVTVFVEHTDEFYEVDMVDDELDTDVVDDGHYVLCIHDLTTDAP